MIAKENENRFIITLGLFSGSRLFSGPLPLYLKGREFWYNSDEEPHDELSNILKVN